MWRIDFFSFSRVVEYFPQLLAKAPVTLLIAASSTVFGLLLATLISIVLLFKPPVLYQLSRVYISFMRAIPINIQLFIFYYGLPSMLTPVLRPFGINPNRADAIYFVIATYAISSAAFLAVMLSASIRGVDSGQSEAALSIGMTRWQMFRRVIAPQAYHIALPELGNNIVTNLKNTALAFTVGVIDMLGVVNSIGARTFHRLEGYVGVAFVYFVICTALEKLFSAVEKKSRLFRQAG
ncbi:MAG: amino acid ABC transporter permease [Treponema sp.]|jgi:L-cystine transport system permease protein|nr:amino acid ABC transporter permease [Treponema sp.]